MVTRLAPNRSGYLEVPEDDARIYWDFFGSGDREVVVLLNGVGMLTEAWYTSVPHVFPDLDVLLFDYLGQGKSTRADVPYSIPRFGQYLARIMDALRIDRVHTVGVSYGGFVAADFGRQYPDRLHTQVLSGILLSHTHAFSVYQDISLRFYAMGEDAFDLYTRYMYEKIFSEKFLRRIHDKLDRIRGKFYDNYVGSIRCLTRLTEAQNPFFDALDRNMSGYAAVDVPTVVVAGEYDACIPLWAQRKLVDIYPNSRIDVLHQCGHLTYFEEPDAFWKIVRDLARDKTVEPE